MFDVIDFLESLGQDAQLRYASSAEVVATLADQPIDPKLRDAILAKDGRGLGAMLGQGLFCCLIHPAKPGEEQEECDGSCKEGEDNDKDNDNDNDKDNQKEKDRNGD